MSAEGWFKSLNQKSPSAGKEKHHGNKRATLALVKRLLRRADRKKANRQPLDFGDE